VISGGSNKENKKVLGQIAQLM